MASLETNETNYLEYGDSVPSGEPTREEIRALRSTGALRVGESWTVSALNIETSEALRDAGTLQEFLEKLHAIEQKNNSKDIFPLGISASELDVSLAAFLEHILTRNLTSGALASEGEVTLQIERFVEGVGLPGIPELKQQFAFLVKNEYTKIATPELVAPLSDQAIASLNAAESIREFRGVLAEHLPHARVEYVMNNILGSLHEGATGRRDGGDEYVEELVLTLLEEHSPLPHEVDHPHLAHLLVASLGDLLYE